MQKSENKIEKKTESKFSKPSLVSCKKFAKYRDVLQALLKDNEMYSLSEVDKLLNNFLTREVK